MTDEQYTEVKAELASNETEHKSFRRRLDEHDAAIQKQQEMLIVMERQSAAIENVSEGVGRVEKKVDSIDSRVAQIEQEPADKWKKIAFEIIKYLAIALIGLAVGVIINQVGQ